MERGALLGLVVLRWAALVWMGVVLVVNRDDLLRPWLAAILVGAALVYTVVATAWVRRTPERLLRNPMLAIDLTIATALVVCDGWVYGSGHAFAGSQNIGSIWPLATVLSVGLASGVVLGAAAGALLGLGRFAGVLANGARDFDSGQVLSLINTTVLYIVAGAVAGYVMSLLRRAER